MDFFRHLGARTQFNLLDFWPPAFPHAALPLSLSHTHTHTVTNTHTHAVTNTHTLLWVLSTNQKFSAGKPACIQLFKVGRNRHSANWTAALTHLLNSHVWLQAPHPRCTHCYSSRQTKRSAWGDVSRCVIGRRSLAEGFRDELDDRRADLLHRQPFASAVRDAQILFSAKNPVPVQEEASYPCQK